MVLLPPGQDATVNFGVQGFDPAVQYGGISGEIFYRDHLNSPVADVGFRPPRAVDGYPQSVEGIDDGAQPFFMVHGNERGFNFPGGHASLSI
jgi:hypothetical protein